MKIKTFEAFNPRIKRKEIRPYQLHVKYEHGDADFDTFETYNFSTEDQFNNVAHFFYDIMNFKPNCAYGNLGYFYPLPDTVNAGANQRVVDKKLEEYANKWGVNYQEYIIGDNHYGRGYATIDGIKATINDEPKVFVFKKALETNKISLPNIGDIVDVDANHIPGYGPVLFGGTYRDYLPNSGYKDYSIPKFKAKVLDCAIDFYHDEDNKHYTEYTHFNYILLLEAIEDVLKPSHNQVRKLSYQMPGWDPEFETKFNKDKYDGLNYYEVD